MSETLVVVIWIVIALLTTRRVFRLAIPRAMRFPTMGNYLKAWILVYIWWSILAYLLLLVATL